MFYIEGILSAVGEYKTVPKSAPLMELLWYQM
jgi:hypothetical protein